MVGGVSMSVASMLVASMLVVSMLVCWWCRGCVTCLKLSPNLRKVSKPAEDKQKVEDLEVFSSISWFVCNASFTIWQWVAIVSTFLSMLSYVLHLYKITAFHLWKALLTPRVIHCTRSHFSPQQQLSLPSASCHFVALGNVQHIQRIPCTEYVVL